MNQTTPKIITLRIIYENSLASKKMEFKEFKKLWNDLFKMNVRDGLGMGKSVKLPFGLGTIKSYLYKPKEYTIDKELSKKYNTEYYDEWADLDGYKLRVVWLNSYSDYPNTSYYKYKFQGTMYKLLRKYTGENKLTQRR